MAHEMRAALQIAAQMHAQYEESRVRLWHPHLSLAWLGVPPGPFIADDGAAALQLHAVAAGAALWADTDAPGGAASAFDLTAAETREGLVEQGFAASSPRLPGGLSREILRQRERRGARRSVAELVMAAWSHPRVLRARIYAARVHRAVLHSPHLRHGMKNAIGVAVLSFPAFLPLDSTGEGPRSSAWLDSADVWPGSRKSVVLFVARRVDGHQVNRCANLLLLPGWSADLIASYVWVLETNTGATWRTGYLRLVRRPFS